MISKIKFVKVRWLTVTTVGGDAKKQILFYRKMIQKLEEINLGYNEDCIDMTINILKIEIKRIKKKNS